MRNLDSTSSYRLRSLPLALAIAATCASISIAGEASPVFQPAMSPSDAYQEWATRHPVAALSGDYLKFRPAITSGTTITVNNCNDSGSGSLRAAIASANTGDTIDLSNRNCTISLTSGEIAFSQKDLIITGPGADKLTIDGGYSSGHYNRIFNHGGNGTLNISGVTLTDAKYKTLNNDFAHGGCILSDGQVVLDSATLTDCSTRAANGYIASGSAIDAVNGVVLLDSVITGNFANAGSATGAAWGAAVYCHGDLTVKYSTVSENSAFGGSGDNTGGGIRTGYGDVYILASTIANNTADVYGGIHITNNTGSHTARIFNSTISSNSVSFGTGGLGSAIPTTIANSTIAFNSSAGTNNGAGVRILSASADIQSSIIAENTSQSGLSDLDVASATSVTGANNLITQTVGTAPGGTLTACPLLGRLSDNGGLTQTHRLLANSPAIDAGNNNTGDFANDQRGSGHQRTYGSATDIGAFEDAGGTSDEIFRSEFENRCN